VECHFGVAMNLFRGVGRYWRRVAGLLICLACLLVLPGCWVFSINPLYDESIKPFDPDLKSDKNLLGNWDHLDDGCHWTLTIVADGQAYHLTMAPGPGCKNDEKTTRYEAHLVKVDTHYFLDLSPKSDDVCELCLAVHTFMLFSLENKNLSLTPFDRNWLDQEIKNKKLAVAHVGGEHEYDAITFTAQSSELKELLRKYADDKTAFKSDDNLLFTKK